MTTGTTSLTIRLSPTPSTISSIRVRAPLADTVALVWLLPGLLDRLLPGFYPASTRLPLQLQEM